METEVAHGLLWVILIVACAAGEVFLVYYFTKPKTAGAALRVGAAGDRDGPAA